MGELDLIIKVSRKFSIILKKVDKIEGCTFGEKLFNYILIKYFNMKDYNNYGLVKEFLDNTFLNKKIKDRIVYDKVISKESVLKIVIGCNFSFEDAIFFLMVNGFSLLEHQYDYDRKIVLQLNDEKFRKMSPTERLYKSGLI